MKIIKSIILIGILFTFSIFNGNSIVKSEELSTEEELSDDMILISDIYVNDDANSNWYDSNHVKSIIEAVNIAKNDDQIFVFNGIYSESKIFIDKPVKLIGQNRENTIVNGIFYISKTSDVKIKGFTFKINGYEPSEIFQSSNCIIEKNHFLSPDFLYGYDLLILFMSSGNCIKDNKFIDINFESSASGIELAWSSNHNTIINNEFLGLDVGYLVTSDFIASNENLIIDNNFNGNEVGLGFTNSDSNIIKNNNFNGNECCMFLAMTKSNNIYNNNMINNEYGIQALWCVNNEPNLIYNNNFDNSIFNAYQFQGNGISWYNNYWADYTGEDKDGEGIGDTPYYFEENAKDDYPLMDPVEII